MILDTVSCSVVVFVMSIVVVYLMIYFCGCAVVFAVCRTCDFVI